MKRRQRARLVEAVEYAARMHGNQTRKQKPVPYTSHLLQVAGLVLENGGDADQAIAGLLHDTIEDCESVTPKKLRKRFRRN